MPTFEKPSVADLRHAADQLGMNPSMMYLNAVQDIVAPLCAAYAALDAFPDEKPAVKYPRDGGWRPNAAENPLNAWYYKTSIKGKASGKLVAFHIQASDNFPQSAATLFPNDAPARECLVRWGDPAQGGNFGTYRIWMTQATFDRWSSREHLSTLIDIDSDLAAGGASAADARDRDVA